MAARPERSLAWAACAVGALYAAAVLKLVAAVLPLLALSGWGGGPRARVLRALSWVAAGILVVYGFVLTAVGLLVQTGLIHTSADADRRALAWHAYLWDPWFLVWGLLIAAALMRGRAGSVSRR